MTELKITKGEWKVCLPENNSDYQTYVYVKDDVICDFYGLRAKENAKLTAEAGTVANETGLTPRQLLEQRDELLDACKEFVRKVECGEARSKRSYSQMKSAIAKAEGK